MEMINQAHFSSDIIRRRLGKFIYISILFMGLVFCKENHIPQFYAIFPFAVLCLHCTCNPSIFMIVDAHVFPTPQLLNAYVL
jgi:hypothetical protein